MGTRLYPCTADTRTLEQLAGVEVGTAEILDVVSRAERLLIDSCGGGIDAKLDGIDIGYAFHQLTSEHSVGRFQDFRLFGWGKFDLSLIPAKSRACGSTSEPELMRRLLESATNSPDDIEQALQFCGGLAWH